MKTYLLTALLVAPLASAAVEKPADWLAARIADGGATAAVIAEIDASGVRTQGFGERARGNDSVPTATTQFQVGSITKAFTNLLLAEMVADGKAKDEGTLRAAFGSDLAPKNEAIGKITLIELATHTSGLPRLPANMDASGPDPYAGYDTKALFAGLNGSRDEQPLGHFYAYSNFGAAALGEALGRLDGRGYREALQKRVIAPLGLSRTGFAADLDAASATSEGRSVGAWRFAAFAPAGAIWSSAGDLAKLVQACLGTQPWPLKHALDGDFVRRSDAGPFSVTRVWHLAPAGDAQVVWHNGATAGFHSVLAFRRDTKQGYVVLLSGDADPTGVVLKALGYEQKPPQWPPVDESVFGQYQLTKDFGIGIFERDGVLLLQATGQMALPIYGIGDDWYALGDVDASVHFVREGGKVVKLELAQNGVVQAGTRTAALATMAARQEVKLDAKLLDEYVGSYALGPGNELTVRKREGGLEAVLTGQQWLPIYASRKDEFFYRVVDAQLRFTRNKAGKVDAVRLLQGAIDQEAPRVER